MPGSGVPKQVISKYCTSVCNCIKKTHHMGILWFFSIESRYDLQVSNHLSNRRHEQHVLEYRLLVLLIYPTQYRPRLSVFHVVSNYNTKNPFKIQSLTKILAYHTSGFVSKIQNQLRSQVGRHIAPLKSSTIKAKMFSREKLEIS